MLENIKSIFFIKLLYSYIKEERKLELTRYNKNLQNIININLINYKFLSKKYIIFETNNKGKEFRRDNDELICEGEYLNKKRNGKGKECYGDKIEFEGEFLNGKRNGKGKVFDWDDNLRFEGEYSNGEKMEKERNIMIMEI